ncbi:MULTISPECIES: dioxygenase [unclassified Adlercreutzia]|uniref:dioxygenase n=1 Tax=unclassified Adlercreutzia TaxID=2636013 RepID=UPI001F15024D|nr:MULTISPECIES: dioxygenase [unclassified Adlercreutzia]
MSMQQADPKHVEQTYRHIALKVPEVMRTCPGFEIAGHHIRSLVFSTDVAVICHCDADAVLAVYPFPSHPIVNNALIMASERPVFVGVGGGVTTGERSVDLASHAEMQGVSAVVLNVTASAETVRAVAAHVDVPVVTTVCRFDEVTRAIIETSASIVNVAAGRDTARVVAAVRAAYPDMPIMASSGPTEQTAAATVDAGADALTWTPPSIQDLEHELMSRTREKARA